MIKRKNLVPDTSTSLYTNLAAEGHLAVEPFLLEQHMFNISEVEDK
jgi:hypothetical protein